MIVDKNEPVMLFPHMFDELSPPPKGFEWVGEMTAERLERFHAKLQPADPLTECIGWTGAHNGRGYPVFAVGRRMVIAGRIALLDIGRFPSDDPRYDPGVAVEAHHTCGNPGCVNPYHLMWATRGDHREFHQALTEIIDEPIDGSWFLIEPWRNERA